MVLLIKNLPANAGDTRDVGSIPGFRRSPGVGNGKLLQHSCMEHPMNRGAWWAPVHGVAKEWDASEHAHTQDMQTPRSPWRSLSLGLALGDSTCTRFVLAGSGPRLGLALGPEPLTYSSLPANHPRAQRRPQLQVQGLFLHVVRFLPATQAVGPERLSLHPRLF